MRFAAVGAAAIIFAGSHFVTECAPEQAPYGGTTEWHLIGAKLRGANVVAIAGRPGWYATGGATIGRDACEYTLEHDAAVNNGAIIFEVCGVNYAWQMGSLGYRS